MVRVGVWLGLAFVAVALAGCTDDKDTADDDVEPGVIPESVLEAIIAVSVNGTPVQPLKRVEVNESVVPTNVTEAAVEVPLGESATFDGSASGPKVLTFAWDFGDNGTGSDQAEEHLYAAPGNYSVRLTVTGGETGNETANTTLLVRVVGVAKGTFLATQESVIEGTLPLMNPNSCTNQGLDCIDLPIPVVDALHGVPALAKAVRVNVTGSGDLASDLQVFWRDPAGTTLAQTQASGLEHALAYAGDMPAGEYVVRIRLFIGAGAEFTGTVQVDYVTA